MSFCSTFAYAIMMVLLLFQLFVTADGVPVPSDGISNVDHGHDNLWLVKPIVIGIILFFCAFLAFYLYSHWKPANRSPRNPLPAGRGSHRSRWFSLHAASSPRANLTPSPVAVVVVRDVPRMPGKVLNPKFTAPTMGPRIPTRTSSSTSIIA